MIPGGPGDDCLHTKEHPWQTSLRHETGNDPWLAAHQAIMTHRNGIAWMGSRMYVPATLRQSVLQRCHDSKLGGHFGFLKKLHLTKRQFWWPQMRQDIKQYVKKCSMCVTTKPRSG